MMQKAEEKEARELSKGYITEGWIKGVIYSVCDEEPLEGSQKGSDKI